RALADCTQEAAAHFILREQCLDQRGLNELVRIRLELGRLATRTQGVDGELRAGVVRFLAVMLAATAAHVQWLVGVERIKETAHGILPVVGEAMLGAMQSMHYRAGRRV